LDSTIEVLPAVKKNFVFVGAFYSLEIAMGEINGSVPKSFELGFMWDLAQSRENDFGLGKTEALLEICRFSFEWESGEGWHAGAHQIVSGAWRIGGGSNCDISRVVVEKEGVFDNVDSDLSCIWKALGCRDFGREQFVAEG